MATSRSVAGGKVATNRRKQRFTAAPYDRPPTPKSPSWFTGVVVPSARAIASGAGKIISSIFSESGTSSSEDEEYASEDDRVNDNLHKIPCHRGSTSNERILTSSKMMHYIPDSRLSMLSGETKRIIEQLIMKETFTREECNRLVKVLYSRIIDWPMEAGKNSIAGSPRNVDSFDRAFQEAKRLLQEKKAGFSSVTELAQRTSNLNSKTLEHLETGGGSPVDVARTYMKSRPSWVYPQRNVELKTLSTVSMNLFQEETLYSASQYSLSPSKSWRSLASGSWDIEEELQIVRSRATEDMLCSRSPTNDASHFAVARIRTGSPGAGEEFIAMGERMTEPESLRLYSPIDASGYAGVGSLTELWQDGKASEALSSKPDTSVSGENEFSESVREDVECTTSKRIRPSIPNHADGLHSDMQLSDVNWSRATEASKFGGRGSSNGPSSQVSLSGMTKNGDEMVMSVEGSGDTGEPFPKARKQQGRKIVKYNRKGKGRKASKHTGKGW